MKNKGMEQIIDFKNKSSGERIAARFLREAFEEHNRNMVSTIIWINNHINHLASQRPDVYKAMNNLTIEQFNRVIAEILLSF